MARAGICSSILLLGCGALGTAETTPPPPPPTFRQIAPLSTSRVTSQTPTLRWAMGPDVEGAHVELCRDRAMTVECTTIDSAGDHAMPPSPLTPGVWYWRVSPTRGGVVGTGTQAVWQFRVGRRSAAHDTSWGAESDFDGDGIADLLVGSTTLTAASAVDLFDGSRSGVSATPTETYPGPPGFGVSIACAGDVDGDGFADAVLGANSGGEDGAQARVFLGGPEGLGAMPQAVLHESDGNESSGFGMSVAAVGDTDGDGYADIAVGGNGARHVWVFRGGPIGIDPTPAAMISGHSAASAGDLDGDGLGDFVVASGEPAMGYVAFGVYLGHSDGVHALSDHEFGTTIGGRAFSGGLGAGDVDGDGFCDVLGVTLAGTTTIASTNVALHRGGPDWASSAALDITRPADAPASFGFSVAAAGDLNADGFDDVAILSGSFPPSPASLYVFLGGATGLAATPIATFVRDGTTCADRALASPGDLDGDGIADLAIGRTCTTGDGSVTILPGRATGALELATTSPAPTVGSPGFGQSIARAL